MDHGFYTKSGSVHALPLLSLWLSKIRKEIQPIWEILSSTIVNNIKKAYCSLVFHQVKESPTELITNIWLDIVHTLRVNGTV